MGLGYDYFTLDEALNFLPYAPSKEWLIEQMFNFDSLENKYSGLQIIPAFHSKQKIYCKYNLSSNDEEITWRRGWFNIHGLNDLKYLSSESILFKSENDEMFLRFDSDDYYIFYPTNEIIVPLNELHIRRDELVHFKSHFEENIQKLIRSHKIKEKSEDQHSGFDEINKKLISIESKFDNFQEMSKDTKELKLLSEKDQAQRDPISFAQEYIRTRKGKMSNEEIVVRLVEDYGSSKSCFYGTIAREFFAECSRRNQGKCPSMLSDNTLSQQGKRFYEKCKIKLEKMS